MRIDATAKVRAGWPDDDDEDLRLDIWAGVIPIRTLYNDPRPDPHLRPGLTEPTYTAEYSRGAASRA